MKPPRRQDSKKPVRQSVKRSSLPDAVDLARRAKQSDLLLQSPHLKPLLEGMAVATTPSVLELVEKYQVRPAEIKAELDGNHPYPFSTPTQAELGGLPPIPLARVLNHRDEPTNVVYGLYPLEAASHVLAVADPNAGKSSTNRLLAARIHRHSLLTGQRIVQICFDMKGGDYTPLLNYRPRDVHIITCPDGFVTNPLDPQDVPVQVWDRHWSAVTAEYHHLLDAGQAFLGNTVAACRRERRHIDLPVFLDYMHDLKLSPAYEPKEVQFRSSITPRLRYSVDINSPMYDSGRHHPIKLSALAPITVFRMERMDPLSAAYLAVQIFLRLLLPLVVQNLRSRLLKAVLYFDEAKLLLPNLSSPLGTSTMTKLISTCREFGIGIVASDQQPAAINPALLMAATKMVFRTEGQSLDLIARSAALTPAMKEWVPRLKPGQAIIRTPRWPSPFRVQFFRSDAMMRPLVTEERIHARMRWFHDLYFPASPIKAQPGNGTSSRPTPKDGQKENAGPKASHTPASPSGPQAPPTPPVAKQNARKKDANGDPFFEPLCKVILDLVKTRQAVIVGDIARITGAPPRRIDKALAEMESLEILKRVTRKYRKGRGGTARFLELAGANPSAYHRHVCDAIETALRAEGCHTIQNHLHCDLVARRNGTTTGYEITLSFTNVHLNISRDLVENGFDSVVIVVEKKEDIARTNAIISQQVTLELHSKVQVVLVDEFLPGGRT